LWLLLSITNNTLFIVGYQHFNLLIDNK
jgi:hypothetical protein